MSNASSHLYKRYLEPGCDRKLRKIPRSTKNRWKSKGSSANEVTTTRCGEASNSAPRDAGEDVNTLADVENQEDISVSLNDSSSVEDNDIQQDEDLYIKQNQEDISVSLNDSSSVEDNDIQQDEDLYKKQNQEDISVSLNDSSSVEDNDIQQDEDLYKKQNQEDISVSLNDSSSVEDNDMQQDEDLYKKQNQVEDIPIEDILFDGAEQDENLNEKHEIKISISKIDLLTLILAFSLRYQVSDTAILSLIEMVNIIMGQKFISPSLYHFWKIFDHNKEKTVNTHFFCEKCHTYLGRNNQNDFTVCSTCGVQVETGNAQKSSCFMSLALEAQIKKLISSGIISIPYLKDLKKSTKPCNQLSDINDGKLYKKLQSKTNSLFLTYNFSVDGVAMFNNAKGSLWPILVTINEIPPTIRFSHVLLAGLWFGKKEPKMDLYLKPFVEETIKLAEKGISLASDCTLKVFAACCCADSVARPCIQNCTQFNGYYGCSWCKHPGFFVNGSVKYIYRDHLLYADRKEQETMKFMHEAMIIGKSIQGVKGPSALLPVPFFNVVSGFTPDYMHGIFLGVTKYLVTSWFDSRNHSQEFYLGSTAICHVINNRMSEVIFPRNVGRVPRSIYERTLYKACEWKNFLLYMCFPCLKGILKQPYMDHICLLAGAVEILMRQSISGKELKRVDELLMKFVTKTQLLYGEEFMTFNMHMLLHYTASVANWGPLWCHSMFVYESYNATVQSFIMGTCGIKTQSVKRFLLHQDLITHKNSYSPHISKFISKINSKSKLREKFIQIGNCNLYGAPCMQIKDICSIKFPTEFLFKNDLLDNANVHYFKRMTMENMLFTVKSEKQFRTCDSLIYTETEIGNILFFAVHVNSAKVGVCISKYEVISKPNKNLHHMYLARKSNTYLIFDAKKIIGKCTAYDDSNGLIIFKVPTSYELST